ncbi:MAG: hypothetical protein FJW23_15440 [Acidimicrobiia bacterium]|nr:hypothetical protein [Acidimicrobiia bacterium]
MRLAWFRSSLPDQPAPDGVAALVRALQARGHDLQVVTARDAYDFVWRHARGWFDLAVYELRGRAEDQYVWPYLLRFPGLTLWIGQAGLNRGRDLAQQLRAADLSTEWRFSRGGAWPALRLPLLASRTVAVPHAGAVALADVTPTEGHLRSFVPAIEPPAVARRPAGVRGRVVCGVLTPDTRAAAVIARAAARLHVEGVEVAFEEPGDQGSRLETVDVAVALAWPPAGGIAVEALAAMALGIPTIVLETRETVDWPSSDPRTWRSRDRIGPPPVCIGLDPLDEEHSLVVALRRLASDLDARRALGEQARQWCAARHAPDAAAAAFETLLEEVRLLDPPAHPADWPAHLTADGTDTARKILDEFGVEVDLFT